MGNHAVETWLLVDAGSLQYISRNKAYSSRQYNDSIYVSTLPRLNVFYVSGKALLLSDILSRSFQDVYLNQSFELSKKMAELIPPLQNLQIPSLTKLDSELLTDYILRNPPAETIDCWPKRYFYSQNVHKTMLHNSSQSIPSEQQLLLGLSLGWQN